MITLQFIFWKTIIYRILIILIQIGFTRLFVSDIVVCINISILWNLLNVLLYFLYELLTSKIINKEMEKV